MKTMKTISTVLMATGIMVAMASCSKTDESPVGKWKSSTSQVVTQDVAGASSAIRTMTIEFTTPQAKAKSGDVVYTASYDVTEPGDSVEIKYQVNASIKGTYTRVKGEDDDYTVAFDTNTLVVNGVDAPALGPVTDAFMTTVQQMAKIEDVEVSKDRTSMSFETDHPDVKYYFVKAE